MTKSETWLWARLKGRQIKWKFRRQHGIGSYVVDFFCPNLQLAVEVDGISHDRKERALSDKRRDKYLSTLGIKVLRFTSEEILRELDRVVENIYQECERITTAQEHRSPFVGGEVVPYTPTQPILGSAVPWKHSRSRLAGSRQSSLPLTVGSTPFLG